MKGRQQFIFLALAVVLVGTAAIAAAAPMFSDDGQQHQVLAKEKHGDSFKQCHSFGPGHSDDACFK